MGRQTSLDVQSFSSGRLNKLQALRVLIEVQIRESWGRETDLTSPAPGGDVRCGPGRSLSSYNSEISSFSSSSSPQERTRSSSGSYCYGTYAAVHYFGDEIHKCCNVPYSNSLSDVIFKSKWSILNDHDNNTTGPDHTVSKNVKMISETEHQRSHLRSRCHLQHQRAFVAFRWATNVVKDRLVRIRCPEQFAKITW